MIKRILVAIDGSEHAVKALELGSDMANLYGADMTLVHVISNEPIPDALLRVAEIEHVVTAPAGDLSVPMAPVIHGSDAVAQREQELREVREHIGRKLLKDGEVLARSKKVGHVKSILEEGDPAERILARADEETPDMIVVGSRGHSKVKALVVGSVSNKVNHRAKCTCVIVK
ncbi:MAG: universal stress protein [Gammaproteobacteria bacterium]|nr:universal stress protein [Gammaproteobacteria bacterium]